MNIEEQIADIHRTGKTVRQVLGFLFIAIACMASCPAAAFQVCWEAPTENIDGTPLTDLMGYVIYFGTASRNYDRQRTLFIERPWPLNDCYNVRTSAGVYYVAMTAFDVDNNESAYSNEVLKEEPRLGGPSGGELLGPSGGGLITEEP